MTESNTAKHQEALLGLFKAYLDDLGRIGARHETLRQFYVTVISALFVFLAMAGKDGLFQTVRGAVVIVVASVGVTICAALVPTHVVIRDSVHGEKGYFGLYRGNAAVSIVYRGENTAEGSFAVAPDYGGQNRRGCIHRSTRRSRVPQSRLSSAFTDDRTKVLRSKERGS